MKDIEPHVEDSLLKQTCDKRKREQMWKGGGTTSAKGGYGGEKPREVKRMEPSWQRGMGNKKKIRIFLIF